MEADMGQETQCGWQTQSWGLIFLSPPWRVLPLRNQNLCRTIASLLFPGINSLGAQVLESKSQNK